MIKELTDLSFDDFINKYKYICILFHMPELSLGERTLKNLEDLRMRFSNIEFATIDADHCAEAVEEFSITSVPTLIFLNKKKVVYKIDKLLSRDKIEKLLHSLRS